MAAMAQAALRIEVLPALNRFALACDWVRMQDEQNAAAANEVVPLRPTFHGVGVDLKEAGRKIKRWFRKDPRS